MEAEVEIAEEVKSLPALRFPEFKEEWVEKKLKDISKINQGLQIAISERFTTQVEGSYFYITNEFLREGNEKKYYIKSPSNSVLCQEDDLLMTRTGNTGMVVTGVSGAFHNNFFKINYERTLVDRWFLYYFLTFYKTQSLILRLAGTSTIPDLNHGDFYKISINLPKLDEQQKIASFLKAVDDKIQQFTKKKALLQKYKKGVTLQIFSQQIRFMDENGLDFPKWQEKKLAEIAVSISNGLSINQNQLKAGFKVTRIETISSGKIDLNKVGYVESEQDIYKYKLEIGDLLFSNINSVTHIGKIAFVYDDLDLYHGMNLLRINIDRNKHFPLFFYYQLTSKKLKQHFERMCNQAVNQASINQTDLKKTRLLTPSLTEQIKIANFLKAIDDKISYTSEQIQLAKQFKKGVLQQMFI